MSRSQPKIWRKIQKIGGDIVPGVPAFFHVWYNQVQLGTSGYQWVTVYQVPVYQVYQEDQDQISSATYISDIVFIHSFQQMVVKEVARKFASSHFSRGVKYVEQKKDKKFLKRGKKFFKGIKHVEYSTEE